MFLVVDQNDEYFKKKPQNIVGGEDEAGWRLSPQDLVLGCLSTATQAPSTRVGKESLHRHKDGL